MIKMPEKHEYQQIKHVAKTKGLDAVRMYIALNHMYNELKDMSVDGLLVDHHAESIKDYTNAVHGKFTVGKDWIGVTSKDGAGRHSFRNLYGAL